MRGYTSIDSERSVRLSDLSLENRAPESVELPVAETQARLPRYGRPPLAMTAVTAVAAAAKPIARHLRRALPLLLTLILTSCVADPEVPPLPEELVAERGVVILNEGLWRMNNASLTLYDPASGQAQTDWFAIANDGEKIGDTGNELVVHDGLLWVVLSESATIEVVELPSGLSRGRVRLPAGSSPRSIAFVDDSTAWVTALDDDRAYRFDPRTLEHDIGIDVGPAPEGIAVAAGRIFVANSGLGALRQDEPEAGTITVLDASNGTRIGSIDVGGNLATLTLVPQTGRLYCQVNAFLPDTTAGEIIEIDPTRLEVLRRFPLPGLWIAAIDTRRQVAWGITHRGLFRLDLVSSGLTDDQPPPELRRGADYSTLAEEVPHSLAVDPSTGHLYLGVARGYYQAPGRLEILSPSGTESLTSLVTGLNPRSTTFY